MLNNSMGRVGTETATISATDVLTVLRADHSHGWDPALAKQGTKEHTRILNSLNEQLNPTFFNQEERKTKIEISQGQILGRGKALSVPVDDKLILKVAPDAVIAHENKLTCVEIKASLNPYSLLQLVYGCIVADHTYASENVGVADGILYLYRGNESVRTLASGGRPFWKDALRIAGLAHEIRLGKESHMMKVTDIPVQHYRERAEINKREMYLLWENISHGLSELLD